MAQVALACLRHQTVPVIPIIGARKLSQLQDNLGSLDLVLSAEHLKVLDGASQIELGFLQSIYEREWFVQLGTAACGKASCSRAQFLDSSMHNIKLQNRLYGIGEMVRPFLDIWHPSG